MRLAAVVHKHASFHSHQAPGSMHACRHSATFCFGFNLLQGIPLKLGQKQMRAPLIQGVLCAWF